MALVPTVSKVSVQRKPDGSYIIIANLSIIDDELVEEVYNENFTQNYHPDDSVDIARDQLLLKMQAAIDHYKSEQTIFNSAGMDTAISYIETNLVM